MKGGDCPLAEVECPFKVYGCSFVVCSSTEWSILNEHCRSGTVDREIFAVKKFSPVAWAAKIKRAKIKYTYTHFIAEPSGGENVKSELFLP